MSQSPLDAHILTIKAWIESNKNNNEIVALLKDAFGVDTSEASIRRCIERNEFLHDAAEKRRLVLELMKNAEAPGVEATDDQVIITDRPRFEEKPIEQLQIEDILRRRNLDPEEWEVKQVLDNQWDANAGEGEKIRLYQFKVWLHKKVPVRILLPAAEPLKRSFSRKPIKQDGTVITVIETDPQNPFLIGPLNELALDFIYWLQPDRWVGGGDLMNLGYIGRHRDNPKWDDTVNDAVQSTFNYLYQRRCAAEDMEMWMIPGNHDDRIRNEQLERNERLYGVTQAHYPDERPGPRVYSLAHLLRLDEIAVNYHEPEGTYEFEFVEITPLLAARHGHKLNASKTAPINTAMELGHSVVLGHSHSQSAVARTVWNKITNEWHVRWAIEAGCECEIEEGLGFNRGGAPDWQPGFVVVTSFPDGKFTFDFTQYTQQEELLFRDKKFTL